MKLSNAMLGVEKTDTQSLTRSRNNKRRRREVSRWTPPPFLVWVTLLALWSSPSRSPCPNFGRHIPFVEATHSETQESARETTPEGKEEDDPNALSEEAEALMNEFLKELHNYSYIKLIVDESQLKPNHYTSRGPPVMIGRRRSLLEHNMHHHYSLHYLKQLKEQQQQQNEQLDQDDMRNAKRRIQEALQAYLYQSPLDAHIKANPQRVQHDTATSNSVGLPPFPPSYAKANKEMLRDMFYKSYNSYMNYSFPAAELLPMTCQPGTFDLVRLPALTLIDALDTLLVLGDSVEFAKSVERLRQFHIRHKKNGSGGIFAVNQNVSVFETTIRVLGGLLSAHQMALAYLPNIVTQTPSHDNRYRNIIDNDDYDDDSSSLKLPPVFLKNVYDNLEDDYLVPTEEVEQILEHRRVRMNSLTQTEQELLDGTCSFDSTKDEHDHCGAGVLALEDCAATKSRSKTLNQTAAALLKKKLALQNEPRWEYDGFLLELAKDIGERLFPAFDTRTGIPYGTVNLLSGVPSGETTVASLAGGGTLSLEFELLSRLTGDLKYGQAAKLAVRALWVRRSSLNLVGKHIDIQRGTWTENLSGIGSNSDSFLEYLLKHYLLFPEEEDFWVMLQAAYNGIFRDARLGEWYADVDMKTGKQLWPKGLVKRVLESLMAFYPGMQTLMGEYVPAARSLNSFFMVREYLGFLPERFSYSTWKVDGGISSGAAKYPLRPELLESCYFMHRASESSSSWQWAASFALHHLERLTRAKCGYASVRGLNPATGNLNAYQNPDLVKLSNDMPSFFLSETIKYLYLTFDDDNIIHKDKDREWIFTTEAHPIHYVPTFEKKLDSTRIGSEDSLYLKSVKEQLRKKLKALKYHKKMQHKGHNTFAPSKRNTDYMVSSNYLATELWSDSTQPRQYRNSFKDVVGEISDENDDRETVEDVGHSLRDFFGNRTALLGFAKFGDGSMYAELFNMAHLTWNSLGLGSGYAMKKACPNIFAPELTWVQALNGGALDYTDVYVSAFSEEDSDYPSAPVSVHLLLSSAEALSVHGSGVYMGNTEVALRHAEQCLIAHHWKKAARAAAKEALQKSSSSQSQPADKESSTPAAGVQQVELSGLGLFEVSAFPEGSGFFMQHVESGESITTSFIVEGDSSSSTAGDVTLMVYASMPRTKEEPKEMSVEDNYLESTNNLEQMRHDNEEIKEGDGPSSPWKFVSPRLASIFKKTKRGSSKPGSEANEKMGDPERAVVIADLGSNAFHCEVNVIRRPLTSGRDETGAGESASESVIEDLLVASYPCAPALFGKTHISKLVASDGVFVERTLQAPNPNDEFGCGSDDVVPTVTTNDDNPPMEVSKAGSTEPDHVVEEKDEEDGSCANKTIQLVQRGQCSFYSKAANQKRNANADGVIVVNTDDDELFVMSYGDDEDADLNDDEMPISVLVTGLDGEEIVGLIQSESIQANSNGQVDSYLLAQISIKKQDTVLDTSGGISTESDDDEVDWPIVKATGDHLQIFAEGGWGIHAMRRDGSSMKDIGGKNDLQLFLLRHSD